VSAAFDLDRFKAACREALAESTPQSVAREIVARAVSEPAALLAALGEPTRASVQALHHSEDLTILHVIWAPRMTIMPHDHAMWAVIGIYAGREDNVFWRRIAEPGGKVEAAGAKSIGEREAVPLGRDIIHSVTNPTPRLTGALHVYGGDFFKAERKEWDTETLLEQPYDIAKALRLFEEANASLARRE
jgi:predicted metal-dependent enzyme (double-stranded beta helix superfamily)